MALYAAGVIIEALYRYLIVGETAREIGIRFGRSPDHPEWRSLQRWRAQLLVSPTLWGWLGPRLGIGLARKAGTKGGKRAILADYIDMRVTESLQFV